MKRKPTTYDKFIRNQKQRALLDREYTDLLISELFAAARPGFLFFALAKKRISLLSVFSVSLW